MEMVERVAFYIPSFDKAVETHKWNANYPLKDPHPYQVMKDGNLHTSLDLQFQSPSREWIPLRHTKNLFLRGIYAVSAASPFSTLDLRFAFDCEESKPDLEDGNMQW